jgi:hypothetical protein
MLWVNGREIRGGQREKAIASGNDGRERRRSVRDRRRASRSH